MDTSIYELNNTSTSVDTAGAAVGGVVVLVLLLVLAVPSLVVMWRLFKKAGQPGWASIVPVYNTIVMTQLAKLNLGWAVGAILVPFVGLYVVYKMVQQYGKGLGQWALVTFLPIVAMFTVGNWVYQGNEGAAVGPMAPTDSAEQSPQPASSEAAVTPTESTTPVQAEVAQPSAQPQTAPTVTAEQLPSSDTPDSQEPQGPQTPSTPPSA